MYKVHPKSSENSKPQTKVVAKAINITSLQNNTASQCVALVVICSILASILMYALPDTAGAQIYSTTSTGSNSNLVIPSSFSFNQNLSFGKTIDPDVKYLQLLLNADSRTVVAASGAGSNQNPTAYFGEKTKNAVMRFQQVYSSEVLTPAGLTQPTGTVGSYTRAKLNSILRNGINNVNNTTNSSTGEINTNQNASTGTTNQPAQNTTTNQTQTSNQTNIQTNSDLYSAENILSAAQLYSIQTDGGALIFTLPPDQLAKATSTKIVISSFSSYEVAPGDSLTIYGTGFNQYSNIVYLGQVPVQSAVSAPGLIKIIIPSYMPTGYYHLAVSNTNGLATSNNLVLTINRDMAGAKKLKPILTKLLPESSQYMNSPVFITGENFGLFNTIITNLGSISNIISNDTKTVGFVVGTLPGYQQAFEAYRGKSINLNVQVKNQNGTSTNSLNHTIYFPNTTYPAISSNPTSLINAATGKSTTSTSTAGSSMATTATDPNDGKIKADPILDLMRKLNPLVKLATDSFISSEPLIPSPGSGGSGGSSGGAAAGGIGAGIGGSSGGSGGSSGGGGQQMHFGGTITQSTVCICNSNPVETLLTVRGTNGQTVYAMYSPPQSTIHAEYSLWTTQVYTLGGLTSGGGACMVGTQPYCSSQGTAQYTIDFPRGIGTGAVPAGK